MNELIKIDEELIILQQQHEKLFIKYGGGYDILSIENKMVQLEDKKQKIIQELFG